jgi:hypothetical protein
MRSRYNTALVSALFVLGVGLSTNAAAEKNCLKISVSKKGKVTTSQKFATSCPRGFTDITDTTGARQVSAENVLLNRSKITASSEQNSAGRLKSDNLRQALDEELAFDIFNLAGSRWKVENFNQAGRNGFTDQGELRFDINSSVVVTYGTVEAIGASLGPGPDWCTAPSYTLNFISPAIAAIVSVPEMSTNPSRGVVQISVLNKDQMVWTGQVPCGYNSFLNVSRLSRIAN